MDDSAIIRKGTRDVLGHGDQHYPSGSHECRAEPHCRPARPARCMYIAAAESLPNTHGSGGTDTERNHVSKTCRIDGNLVGGERKRIERADQRGGGSKNTHFD